MKKGYLSQYFEGVAAKRLSAVEANPKRSNQHEFNGVRALKELLGEERLTDCPARFIWLGDEDEGVSEQAFVTWYDSRENHPERSEYRLYFRGNRVMELAEEGDLLLVAKRPGGELTIIVGARGSTVENQLLWLFGIPANIGSGFEFRDFGNGGDVPVDFPVRFVLEELDVEIEEPEAGQFDELLKRFGGVFPTTAEFSAFARETLPDVVAPDDPDAALLAWMEQEERLFRQLERHIVSDRLKEGFWSEGGADVDGFISFSLSVHNRRKSRTGYALENHLEELFRAFGIRYERHGVTENNSKPDFLFPGAREYHDAAFPEGRLTMLGVKSTCKDRWRQVLAEAARIPEKHLLTLEPGISENQTREMKANKLGLVLPEQLHGTYSEAQRAWLLSVEDFIGIVRARQA